MRGRLRTLAALLALFALSAYFAESVMASWCMPGTETSSAASAETAAEAAHTGTHHGGPRSGSPGSEHSDPGEPACSFGMTGGGASCVVASLPATTEAVPAAPTASASPLGLVDRSPHLLLVTAHFRPPRA